MSKATKTKTFRLTPPLTLRAGRESARLTLAGLLFVSVPAFWVAMAGMGGGVDPDVFEPLGFTVAAIVGSLLTAVGGGLVIASRDVGRYVALVGLLATLPLAVANAALSPALTFVGFAWVSVLVSLLTTRRIYLALDSGKAQEELASVSASPVVAVGGVAILTAIFGGAHRLLDDPLGHWAIYSLMAVTSVFVSWLEIRLLKVAQLDSRIAVTVWGLTVVALCLIWHPSWFVIITGVRIVVAVAGAMTAHELRSDALRFLWARPAYLVILTFAVLSFVGGLILTFPMCSTKGESIPLLDALFTAVSASCVTGLAVLDTGSEFTRIGQFVILGLIQVGALGIMSLSAIAALLFGRSLASQQELAVAEYAGGDGARPLRHLLRSIGFATVFIEGIGAILLLPVFLGRGLPVADALFAAVFHSVSAFCNAGFALQSDSLVGFADNPYALHVFAALILFGGTGFGVMAGLLARFRGRVRLGLHSRIALSTNLILLVLGFLTFVLFEWEGGLGKLGGWDRLHSAWFQSVTLRTAGFNSVDYSGLAAPTVLSMIAFMFIGASPGSTGGGIKTTTVGVLMLAVLSVIRGRPDAEAFGRRLPVSTVFRAAAIATVSAMIVAFGAILLMLTQTDERFDHLLFEAVSAFGTVGLSLGATAHLDRLGKLIIMGLMFVGRTGPLTMFLLFRRREPAPFRYPEEEVLVG